LLSVSIGKGPVCQTKSHIFFVSRMDVFGVSYVAHYHHTCIGYFKSLSLRIAQPGAFHGPSIFVRCYLHIIKWKIIPPMLPPIFYQCREKLLISARTIGVCFALVPKHSSYSERDQGSYHGVKCY